MLRKLYIFEIHDLKWISKRVKPTHSCCSLQSYRGFQLDLCNIPPHTHASLSMSQEQSRNSADKAAVVTLVVSSGVLFYLLLSVLKTVSVLRRVWNFLLMICWCKWTCMCFYKSLAFMDLLKKSKSKNLFQKSSCVVGRMEWGRHLFLQCGSVTKWL